MEYQTLIGLEIHVELKTSSKMFCGCSADFGGQPNTQCCPVCLGLPGALPVLNKKALEFGIKAGLALHCEIASMVKMDRKNYFYPDLPKSYQVTQLDKPLCKNGFLDILKDKKEIKRIRIQRIHMEEDTGKSQHRDKEGSYLDYNRSGVSLIELVTEPDMNSSEEAYQFLEKLKGILEYLQISDCKMEEGSLRCDINVNVEAKDGSSSSPIVELKNLNSFKAAMRAIEYEEKRHIELLKKGLEVKKESRKWDEKDRKTVSMRPKALQEEYRYFTEQDIPMMSIDKNYIEELRKAIPELPEHKKKRFVEQYGLPAYDAGVITASPEMANFFEEVVRLFEDGKIASNWIMTQLYRELKERELPIERVKFTPRDFAELLELMKNKVVSGAAGKKILAKMFEAGGKPESIARSLNLVQVFDEKEIRIWIEQALKDHPQSIEDYRQGKKKALGFIIGQVMKLSKGKANPELINKLIREEIEV